MSEYLIFVKKIGDCVYHLDFSEDAETAWGESWEVTPSCNNPNICPERNAISSSYRIETNGINFNTACNNTCFSMQDCTDGIIALAFTNPGDKITIILNFGVEQTQVWEKLRPLCKTITQLELDGDDAIEGLINDLNEGNTDE